MAKKTRTELDMESGQSKQGTVLRFGAAALHVSSRELFVAGQKIELEPKPLDLLFLLLSQPGTLQSKESLFADIWAGRIVTDSVLTRCVAKLRQALGEGQDCIETVHGYGYRFKGEVTRELPETALPSESSARPSSEVGRAVPAIADGGHGPPYDDDARPEHDEAELPQYRVEFLPGSNELSAEPHRLRWPLLGAAAACVVVLAGFAAISRYTASAPASVAVLPFENLSPDPGPNAFLAGGIHDNILTHLTRVRGLSVISRTSVMQYAGGKHDLRKIGKDLGVGHILEGSVQRVGGRVLVNAQLIDAATDRHVWAEAYDRPVDDVLGIQSEIAERVALGVGAQLSDVEVAAIRRKPTRNAQAYETYLQARDEERRDSAGQESLMRIQALLERAVNEDPKFALAHAGLGRTHSLIYWFAYDPTPERRDRAKAAVERALELEPDLAEAHLAQGIFRAAGFRDYIGAVQSYGRALALQPSSSEILRFLASSQRRQGQWNEAVSTMRRAVELDPANAAILEDLAGLYRGLRRYAEAEPLYDRVVTLTPGQWYPKINRADLQFYWNGDLEPLKKVLAAIPPEQDTDHSALYCRFRVAMWESRFAEAAELLAAYPSDWLPAGGGNGRVPKELSLGHAHRLAGNNETASGYYRSARALLETELSADPDNPGVLLGLAQAFAGLGEREAALKTVRRALDLMPATLDPFAYGEMLFFASVIHTDLGDHELALTELEQMMALPFGQSVQTIRILPFWKPLRSNPRFKALVAKYSPQDAGQVAAQ